MMLKNKYGLYLFLLYGIVCVVMLQLPLGEDSTDICETETTTPVVSTCTFSSTCSSNLFSEGELPPASSTILLHVKKMVDEAKANSHTKHLNVKVTQLERAECNFFAKSHYLHDLHLSHHPTQSQLQIFII